MPQNKLKRGTFSNQVPGFPGYRTRTGRSGYDPLDTNRFTNICFMVNSLHETHRCY
jgi:hypothetical protein